MEQFVLFFRMDITTPGAQPSAEQMKVYMEQWEKWIESIASKNKLVGGNHLSREGVVLKPNNKSSNGPYVANEESVAGYIIVKAKNLDQALEIAKGCPILEGKGTSVEVRQVASS